MRIKWLRGISTAFGMGLLVATVSILPRTLELEEDLGLAWLFALRGPMAAPDSVAVVGISGESAEALQQRKVLDARSREPHARLIERLDRAGAAVIVVDISFEVGGDPEQDAALARAIDAAGNVLLLVRVTSRELDVQGFEDLGPLSGQRDLRFPLVGEIERAALAVAPFKLPRVPIRVSQFWVFDGIGSDRAQLPVVALQAYLLPRYEVLTRLLVQQRPAVATALPPNRAAVSEVGLVSAMRELRRAFLADPDLAADLLVALAESGLGDSAAGLEALIAAYAGGASRYLNFSGPSRTVRTVAYHEALEMPEAALAAAVAGRVVFVGFSELRQPEQQDEFVTVYSERSGISLSGVEIGATAFANLLDRVSVRPLSIPAHWLWVVLWGTALIFALSLMGLRAALATTVGAGVLYLAAAVYAFESAQSWWPLVVPLGVQLPLALATVTLFRYHDVNAQRRLVQTALGRYLPASVVNRLADDSFDAGADRELVHGTCLITDIEQYTGVAEALPPDGLVELMRDYFALLSAGVERSGGYVADVSGDSMVAIWAAAKPDAGLRRQACAAALAMHADVERFNRGIDTRDLPTGMGLDSGAVVLGNIGAGNRFRFRAVGDIVNTASRIQGLNRRLGTRVLVSNATLAGLPDVRARRVGEFLLVGKRSTVAVSELLGTGDQVEDGGLLELFAEGLRLFEQRRWSEARRRFERALEQSPGDGPSLFYIAQCETFAARTLPEDWAGTIQMTVK